MEKTDAVIAEEGVVDVKNQTEKSSVLSPLPLQKRGDSGVATEFSSLTPARKNEQSHIAHEIDTAELPEKSAPPQARLQVYPCNVF